ncbi:MAG: ABC transporter substrate-binding protein [Oscillospiraceae bacterium]|nr:ABC transporter substrate-binding protein [Oscillospiraceae bacterium]
MKRILAAALAVLLLTSCSPQEEQTEAEIQQESVAVQSVSVQDDKKETELILSVGRDFSTTHPAKMEDEASEAVVPLLYESLVSLGDDYHWQPELAESIEQDGLTYTVTLRDAVFSDDSTVRAADVVNSMARAREEGSNWASRLSIVEDCVVLTANMVRITLTEHRQDFENLLTFPIAKEQNDGSCLGSGQYLLGLTESGEQILEPNPNYSGSTKGPERIYLKELPNSDSLHDSLRIGSISCLFDDLSSGEAMKLSEKMKTVEIGHLVFLGVNGEEGLMAQTAVRKAVGAAVNRQMLVDRVYASKATATDTPFHPSYYRIEDAEEVELSYEEARQLLLDAGLMLNPKGYFSMEEQSTLRLLYNSENSYRQQTAEMLLQQLNNIGLQIELLGLSYSDYMAALEDGNFDLYLGELAIDESMDIRRLIEPGENYGFCCTAGNSVLQVYNSYQQGTASAELFLTVFQQNLPLIPLLYRQGLIVYDEDVTAAMESAPGTAFAAVFTEK